MLTHLRLEIARIALDSACVLDPDQARRVADHDTYLELLHTRFDELAEFHGPGWPGAALPRYGLEEEGDGAWDIVYTTNDARTRIGILDGEYRIERLPYFGFDRETRERVLMDAPLLDPESARDCLLACLTRAQGAPVRQRALFELARLFDDELDVAELAREVLVDTSPGTDEDRAVVVLVNSARQSWSEKLEAWRARYSEQALANAANCHDPIAWERPPDMDRRFRDALNTLPRTKGLRLRT